MALPKEAHELFLKLCAEAGSQGSLLGSLKYLHRHVQALAGQLGDQIARVEAAQRACIDTRTPRRVEGG